MRRRRSDSEDRPSDSDLPPRGDGAAEDRASPGSDSGPYPWWDWSDDVAELDASVRSLAEALAGVVEGAEGLDDLTSALEESAETPLEDAWEAVAALHRSLDRCRDAAPAGGLREVRERLDDAAGRLWAAGAEREVWAVREFVREVAHDFRSPLHSVLFLTDALFREENGPLTAAQKRQVSVVHSAAAALLRLSSDLMDFSGGDEAIGPEEVEEIPFSPAQVVEDLQSLLEPVSHHQQAELTADVENTELRVGDPQVLNRILLNLACNGLEAVEEGGTVRIRITGDDDGILARVEDDSGEADPQQLRRLTEGGSYSSVVRRLGGETGGLGLVICGRMVRAVDGDLEVERTDDGWTRFSVTLPFAEFEPE